MTHTRCSRGRRRPASGVYRRPTVLFLDDDPDEIGAFVAAMRYYDVRVLTNFSGEQGFLEALRSHPDLIVTDLRMPQGSGEMLLECLQRNNQTRAIPVIVITGQRRSDLPGYVRHLGAAQFLTKPVAATTLIEEMRKHIRLRPAVVKRAARASIRSVNH